MEGVIGVVYFDGDMRSIFEGVLFECPNGPKFIKISEEMLLIALRKVVTNVIKGKRSRQNKLIRVYVWLSNYGLVLLDQLGFMII